MSEPPDIRAAADAVLRAGRLTEVPAASPGAPLIAFDGEDHDLVVEGDLESVNLVRGERSIVVQGDVRGTAQQPVRVEVKGDVIVLGSARHAHLRGRNVLVAGDLGPCVVTAAARVAVGGNLEDGRLVTGDYEDDRRRIEACRMSLEQTRMQTESIGRRVATEEKRLDKACGALRIPLNFTVGRIVRHDNGRVVVDLGSFYGSLEGRSEDQLELALGEFFAKGVVGVITRANRKYLVNYPAREKVFMQLVKGLRELFQAVLERDRLVRRVAWLERRLDQVVESLSQRRSRVEVGGAVAGDTEMEFILPRVVRRPKGEDGYDFAHRTARLEIRVSSSGAAVVSRGAEGERNAISVPSGELECLCFGVADGRVHWEPVAVAVGV